MTHFQCPECDIIGKTPEDIIKNGCKCRIQPTSYLDQKDHEDLTPKKRKQKNEKDKKKR